LPRRAADGGEGEAPEEVEAVVDLGQQLWREALELSSGGGPLLSI
jgi:hypothetical protein